MDNSAWILHGHFNPSSRQDKTRVAHERYEMQSFELRITLKDEQAPEEHREKYPLFQVGLYVFWVGR